MEEDALKPNDIREFEIHSLAEYEEMIFSWNNSTQYVYRGTTQIIPLLTHCSSLKRKIDELRKEYRIDSSDFELFLIEKFKEIYRNEYTYNNPLELLEIMQHFEIPTRLLDTTTDPLVALFFACQPDTEKKDKDGCVYVIPTHAITGVKPIIEILSETAKWIKAGEADINSIYQKCVSCAPKADWDYNRDIETLKGILRGNILTKLDPVTNNQCKQSGSYILTMNRFDRNSECIENELTCISGTSPSDETVPSDIIIRKEEKAKILKELETREITQETLLPDRHIVNFYKAKMHDYMNEYVSKAEKKV